MARRRRGRSQYFSRRPTRGVRGRRKGHAPSAEAARRAKRKKGVEKIKEKTKELLIDRARWAIVSTPPTIYAGAQMRKSALASTYVERMKRPGTVPPRAMPTVVRRAVQRKATTRAGAALTLRLGVRVAGHFAGPFAIAFWAYDIYTIGKWVFSD